MKKIVRLTETDLERIVKRVINEQNETRSFIRAIQRFLIDKKITGDNKKPLTVDGRTDNNLTSQTAQAISKYQSMIGVYPADGVWEINTWEKMPKEDQKKLKKLMAEEGDIFDKFLHWMGWD